MSNPPREVLESLDLLRSLHKYTSDHSERTWGRAMEENSQDAHDRAAWEMGRHLAYQDLMLVIEDLQNLYKETSARVDVRKIGVQFRRDGKNLIASWNDGYVDMDFVTNKWLAETARMYGGNWECADVNHAGNGHYSATLVPLTVSV